MPNLRYTGNEVVHRTLTLQWGATRMPRRPTVELGLALTVSGASVWGMCVASRGPLDRGNGVTIQSVTDADAILLNISF